MTANDVNDRSLISSILTEEDFRNLAEVFLMLEQWQYELDLQEPKENPRVDRILISVPHVPLQD